MASRLIALLACQEISHDDGDTLTLSRVVSSLSMRSFPTTVGGYLFVRVADLAGDHVVRLEVRDSERGVVIGGAEWDARATPERDVHDFTVHLDLQIPGPTTIEARILIDGEVIGWTDFDIQQLPASR
jgi:hypothetical protein